MPSVAGWRLASLPWGLDAAVISRLPGSCDRGTVIGRRDFAILVGQPREFRPPGSAPYRTVYVKFHVTGSEGAAGKRAGPTWPLAEGLPYARRVRRAVWGKRARSNSGIEAQTDSTA